MGALAVKTLFICIGPVALIFGITGCSAGSANPSDGVSSIQANGATFKIEDAAVYSNCLSLTFGIRGFVIPPEKYPQEFFPPAKSIEVKVTASAGELTGRPLGGGGGGGGDEDDGRVWMEQQLLYSLDRSVPQGEEVSVEIILSLDDDFGRAAPLEFHIPLTAGPGGGDCH
jgi:hypothetical protein